MLAYPISNRRLRTSSQVATKESCLLQLLCAETRDSFYLTSPLVAWTYRLVDSYGIL